MAPTTRSQAAWLGYYRWFWTMRKKRLTSKKERVESAVFGLVFRLRTVPGGSLAPTALEERPAITSVPRSPFHRYRVVTSAAARVGGVCFDFTTHVVMIWGMPRIRRLRLGLAQSYDELRRHWRKEMARRTSVREVKEGVLTIPGQAPSEADLERAEAYFKHHDGVYVSSPDWDDEDLTEVVAADGASA